MRSLFLLFLLYICVQPAVAQPEDNLSKLLSDREQLTLEYQYLNQQNSNFWGKKSKKDLLQIIETLKNIINKDSEIIREINIASIKNKTKVTVETGQIKRQVFDDKRVFQDNVYQLKQDLASLKNREKLKQQEINTLQNKLKEARKTKQDSDKILAVSGGFCLILLIYVFVLRSQISKPKTRSSRAKK